MKATIIPIGNSRGIRIPKSILEQCRIKDSVELEVDGDRIVIKPLKKRPRVGWTEKFERMHELNEDALVIGESIDAGEDWEW